MKDQPCESKTENRFHISRYTNNGPLLREWQFESDTIIWNDIEK